MQMYPTSVGPSSSKEANRLPVVSNLLCEQITAFGADVVPDVKINAQGVSAEGWIPGSASETTVRAASRSSALILFG
ncbi:unannotated protein [freshwater metagenome]|uniref:Unannotated protein n=1 Tax=freshwater metagenome TaxID=449393 RepID=A0A6J6ZDP0_9ZZZZ